MAENPVVRSPAAAALNPRALSPGRGGRVQGAHWPRLVGVAVRLPLHGVARR